MDDAGRFRLLGRYRIPRVRYGQTVRCLLRGAVEVVGLHDGPIPWPVGKRGRHQANIVFKDLAKAVRRESGAGGRVLVGRRHGQRLEMAVGAVCRDDGGHVPLAVGLL